MIMPHATNVLINRKSLTVQGLSETPLQPLGTNMVRLRIERFAVTANNVTYAAIGEAMGYWDFFPAPEGTGRVPMWGHAVVAESTHPDVAAGERVYGYVPMGTYLDIEVTGVSPSAFSDGAPHRQGKSPFYNQYRRLAADPAHNPNRECERMFSRAQWYDAEAAVMTSASSKTALALANVTRAKSPQIKRIGLTSVPNKGFVTGTGLYDQVLSYDEIGQIEAVRAVSVDFAGNGGVLRSVHEALGARLAYSCLVGLTHWEGRGGPGGEMPGPQPILFFAPDHATATIGDMGPAAFGAAVAGSWTAFVDTAATLVRTDEREGLQAAANAFTDIAAGTASPDVGVIIRP
jgi:Protein of unknown function (DUF2855)